MNKQRESSLLRTFPALAAGGAPAGWRHQMANGVEQLAALPRLCDWIESFDETADAIRLSRGALLGNCLTELTGGAERVTNASDDLPDEVSGDGNAPFANSSGNTPPRSSHSQPARSDALPGAPPSPDRKQRQVMESPSIVSRLLPQATDVTTPSPWRSTGLPGAPPTPDGGLGQGMESRPATPRTRQQASVVTKLPRQTDAVRMKRWAKHSERLGKQSLPPADKTNAKSSRQPASASAGSTTGQSAMPAASQTRLLRRSAAAIEPQANRPRFEMPVATAEAGVTESFLNRLSQRAGHKLRQPVQFSDHKLRQPVLFANANGQVATLRPWAAPIAAPQISQTLLKSLAAERQLGNPQLNTGQPKNGAAKERASLADQRSNNDHQLNSARAFRFQPLTQSPPAAWAGERPATNRFLKDSTLPSPSGNGETAEALAGALSPNSSAALAPELPPMLPPSDIGVPILPLAASSAQHGARGEAVAIEDDLDALAAKIKLILDEQARRYGIDV